MEINVNFVLFDEPNEKPDGSGAETRIVIIQGSKDAGSALNSADAEFDLPE